MRPLSRSGLARVPGTRLAFLLAAATVSTAPSVQSETARCTAGVPGEEPPRPAPCCFVNPYYAGVCVVRPAKDETCAGILAYLNNPRSAGKLYCSNTPIRGNWRQVVCEQGPEPQERSRSESPRQRSGHAGAERR
jgi:hypothetical protein